MRSDLPHPPSRLPAPLLRGRALHLVGKFTKHNLATLSHTAPLIFPRDLPICQQWVTLLGHSHRNSDSAGERLPHYWDGMG